jgi:hypothetical protein
VTRSVWLRSTSQRLVVQDQFVLLRAHRCHRGEIVVSKLLEVFDWVWVGACFNAVVMQKLVLKSFALLAMMHFSTCELVQYAALDGFTATIDWTTAGANFEPHINEVCTEVDGYASFDVCAVQVRELFLAADLKLWNALDAKNLTWEQRPARSMPARLVDQFTFGGKIQHLHWYRSDSGSPHPPYSSGEIDVLIDRARSRVPGSAYPHVDASLFSC